MSNLYTIYTCPKCGEEQVRKAGGLHIAQVISHCGAMMQAEDVMSDSDISDSPGVGTRTLEEIDVLLSKGKYLYLSGTYATLYTISKGNEPEYRYHLTIENEAKTQRYHESFRTLEQIVEHEPFDLSRFRVGKQKEQ